MRRLHVLGGGIGVHRDMNEKSYGESTSMMTLHRKQKGRVFTNIHEKRTASPIIKGNRSRKQITETFSINVLDELATTSLTCSRPSCPAPTTTYKLIIAHHFLTSVAVPSSSRHPMFSLNDLSQRRQTREKKAAFRLPGPRPTDGAKKRRWVLDCANTKNWGM